MKATEDQAPKGNNFIKMILNPYEGDGPRRPVPTQLHIVNQPIYAPVQRGWHRVPIQIMEKK